MRVSVSMPLGEYNELKEIATGLRVSLAWIVRDAITTYLNARNPLFRNKVQDRA